MSTPTALQTHTLILYTLVYTYACTHAYTHFYAHGHAHVYVQACRHMTVQMSTHVLIHTPILISAHIGCVRTHAYCTYVALRQLSRSLSPRSAMARQATNLAIIGQQEQEPEVCVNSTDVVEIAQTS